MTGDLALYRHGHLQLVTTGIKGAAITSLAVSPDGSVLGSTRTGVVGWKNGKVQLLSSANGLPCDGAASLVFSDRHSFLFSSLCGLIQIEEEELQKWWKNPKAQIAYRVFDSFNGARVSPTSFEPRISKGIDGKIWFANKTELQMFDPAHVAENRIVPPVHIEEVIADRKTYGISNSVSLPPLTRDLEIRYVALSFVTPQKVRFRYKLEGHDADWQEPGGRREAFYENLAPGHYRFRVIACNNDGIWNETGASQDFGIQPTWYQTSWFRILSALCVLLLFWTIYRLRVRYIARAIGARFDERLAERTRMARELHDTFLQTVQGSKMVADDALDEGSNEARMRHALERLSLWLGQAVTEGRAALHALRISTTERNHLAESLRQAAEDNCGPASLSLALTVIGDPKDLHPIVRDEISRIGYEAIRNACMHSHGSQLEIELRYAEDLTVAVKDNGVGIDPTVAHDGKDGHFGLQGMRERAARIRGKLTILSTISAGTTVTLRVPGNLVYRNGPITILERTKRALRRLIGTPDIVETDGGSQ
jgi:signal transduction histidine kinase